ncbi:MAG: hypothetical protein Q7T24_07905 [Deltaproteobacteria bacterium]|nr:hypothetical protein [Deltaproteobacteria bacterium]
MVKKVTVAVIVFLFSALIAAAYAVQEIVDLKGQAIKDANGEALIRDAGEGRKKVEISLKGLDPNSVYTVWFAKDRPGEMAGIGGGNFSFRSDAVGNGQYSALIPEKEITNWDNIEVLLHPDGNPGNTRNAKVALKGDLSEANSRFGP